MDYETYLRAVLDANLTEVKDEIKELIIEKMLEYKSPKKGRWIVYDARHCLSYCSECRNEFDYPWNYCPSCGAKMKE